MNFEQFLANYLLKSFPALSHPQYTPMSLDDKYYYHYCHSIDKKMQHRETK